VAGAGGGLSLMRGGMGAASVVMLPLPQIGPDFDTSKSAVVHDQF